MGEGKQYTYDHGEKPNTRQTVRPDKITIIVQHHWVPEDPNNPTDCETAEQFNQVNHTLTFNVVPGTFNLKMERDVDHIRDETGKVIEVLPVSGSERFTISGSGAPE